MSGNNGLPACGNAQPGLPVRGTQTGAAALVTVIIVMAATLAMAAGASRLGIGELELGFTGTKGAEAFAIADGCMEETLRRIRIDTDYAVASGTVSLTVPNGSCTIEVSADGDSRTVAITGTHGEYHATIEGVISLSGDVISVTSWEEKSE